MIACGRSCFQEVSETPVATGKSGPQSWHKTTPKNHQTARLHFVNLGKALQRVLEKVLLRDHQLKLQSPGPKFWWFLLMDGLNIWWDLWWVFDRRSEISMNPERFVGLNPISAFFGLDKKPGSDEFLSRRSLVVCVSCSSLSNKVFRCISKWHVLSQKDGCTWSHSRTQCNTW